MTTHLVTFSDESMSRAAELCVTSAKASGISVTHRYGPSDVAGLLQRSGIDPTARGCGYWAWKAAVILGTMYNLGLVDTAFNLSGDNYIIYADAGVEFIAPVSHITTRMDHDVWLFGNNYEHAHWCKADVVAAIWPTNDRSDPMGWHRFGKQVQASVIFFRVSDCSRRFVQEWLAWCLTKDPNDSQVGLSCGHWWKGNAWSRCPQCGDVAVENRSEYLIDDSPSRNRNHPEFQEHRHDQAILTTMAYRGGIPLHWWPAMYNDGAFTYEKLPCYAGDDYPVLFHHHRRRDNEWS